MEKEKEKEEEEEKEEDITSDHHPDLIPDTRVLGGLEVNESDLRCTAKSEVACPLIHRGCNVYPQACRAWTN